MDFMIFLARGLSANNLRKIKCILQNRLATVDCVSAERGKASEFLARALSTILLRSSVEVFFVLISVY